MDIQTIRKVARLSRLKLDETRLDEMTQNLSNLFTWIDQLQEVDTDGVEPMTSMGGQKMFRRADIVTDGHKQADILANAPEAKEGFFVVPKVVE